MMPDLFAMMARYNQWANGRIFDAAAGLPDNRYREDLDAHFRSVHGTLNHLLVADRIWLSRFTGAPSPSDRLDTILYQDFDALRTAREAEDAAIINYVDTLDEAALAGSIRYRTIVDPQEISQPLAPALMHFFNHQTHHRGQVHALMTRLTGTAPALDLIYYQRETAR